MSEIFFVIKSAILTILVVMGMQVTVSGKTIESHFFSWIRNSSIGQYLTHVAHGGTALVSNGTKVASDFASRAIMKSPNASDSAQASRLDFEFKRSPSKKSGEDQD